MLGGAIKKPEAQAPVVVRHTAEVVCGDNGVLPLPKESGVTLTPKATAGHPIKLINMTTGARTQIVATSSEQALTGSNAIKFVNPAALGDSEVQTAKGDHVRIFWEEVLTNNEGNETAVEVTISPDTFPGTYRVVGDTYMRSQATGKDEPFQFVINKAKVQSSVTLTLQAEGDPTTFSMTLNVLRSTNDQGENEMMKLIRYNVSGSTSSASANDQGSIVTGSGL